MTRENKPACTLHNRASRKPSSPVRAKQACNRGSLTSSCPDHGGSTQSTLALAKVCSHARHMLCGFQAQAFSHARRAEAWSTHTQHSYEAERDGKHQHGWARRVYPRGWNVLSASPGGSLRAVMLLDAYAQGGCSGARGESAEPDGSILDACLVHHLCHTLCWSDARQMLFPRQIKHPR